MIPIMNTKKNFLDHYLIASMVLLILFNSAEALCNQKMKSYIVQQSSTNIAYDAGGVVDEASFLWPSKPTKKRPVSTVMIRNTGDHVVVNPRVSVNGFQPPLTTAELLSAITQGSEDPLDRLLRIYHAIDHYSIHEGLGLGKVQDRPLTSFIGYGGGMCEDRANIQSMLWSVLGHKWRNSMANNHTVHEVECGSRMLHLDTDIQAYYLMHDNWNIASSQDIREDPMLVLRAVNYRNYMKYPRSAKDPETDMWYSSEKVAALYGDKNHTPLSSNAPVNEEYNLLLRPGEAYGWHTGPPRHVHPAFSNTSLPDALRDFIWETKLDFSKSSHHWAVKKANGVKSPVLDNVVFMDGNTAISISYDHPFPMTGAELELRPDQKASRSTLIKLTVTGGNGRPATFDIPLEKLSSGPYSLSAHIRTLDFPVHRLNIEISLSNADGAESNAVPLNGLSLTLYSQATSYAFRSLKAGRNHLKYSDASVQRSIELQVHAVPLNIALPGFPKKASFHPSDRTVGENAIAFSWPKSQGRDVKGYQFQISAFADMRYPLSPTFDRIIEKQDVRESKGRITFKLPWRGMLPVSRDLYWRVRAFRNDLLAGPWSRVSSFKVKGPQAPEKINIEYDKGKVILSWSAAEEGTRPHHYEIHSSLLEGFIPVSEPHRVLGFSNGTEAKYKWHDVTATDWPVVPETTTTTTKDRRIVLYDPSIRKEAGLGKAGAHFRVIAIDAEGSRSCPSRQAHLRSPLITMPETVEPNAGNISLQVPIVSTFGRITTKDPYFLGLWSKPAMKFSLSTPDGRKDKWSIDENLGVIKGHLREGEDVSLTVTVEDQFRNKDIRQINVKAK
jgi:hypothetical protein